MRCTVPPAMHLRYSPETRSASLLTPSDVCTDMHCHMVLTATHTRTGHISAKPRMATATAGTCSDLLVRVLAAADAAAADDGHPALRQLVHLPQHIGREPQQRFAAETSSLQITNVQQIGTGAVCIIQLMLGCRCSCRRWVTWWRAQPQQDIGRCGGIAATSPPCWCWATAPGRERVVLPTTSPSTPSRSVSAAMSCNAHT